ncbi:hypothetical protein [Micromonospora endolithica]|uniref:Secreted protein n=1 Tax=Micromonospora endolithica TaxID=230091 RepID=A0A3A9ZM32_9ACTN|nr:hypothetical protein [Micromonospora endolithica]RKN49392.1 hypothetical protein D7223_07820 [Micromonospora endolithica]TWJ23584.1 hypothetical protein JD76_03723 [Micromonospora endolithica]
MLKIGRRKAMVVAFAVGALTLAGGGVAVAQPSAKAPAEVTQASVRQPGGQPPVAGESARRDRAARERVSTQATLPGTISFAVVNPNGTLARPLGVGVSVYKFPTGTWGAGKYQVTFPYNVSAKAYVATIGDSGPGFVPDSGEIGVAPRTLPAVNSVFVQTRNSAGVEADRGFHLVIAN